MRGCCRYFFWLLLLAGPIVRAASDEILATNSPIILTNAAQVRALTAAEAVRKLPVRLKGILVEKGNYGGFTLVDGNVGLYGEAPGNVISSINRGDLIEVEGVSNPGRFAPFLTAWTVRKLGHGEIPEPLKPNADTLLSGCMDAQWIEVSGIVRQVEPLENGARYEVNLDNGSGRMLVNVAVRGTVPVDSSVQLRGVCFYLFNTVRQVIRPYLSIPEGEPIIVKESGPANLDTLPIRPVQSLLQFSADQTYAHRLRVRGAVIYAQAGDGFWIHEAGGGLRIFCDEKEMPEPGTEVDVFGFLKRGQYGPAIEDAIFRKTGRFCPAIPIHLAKATDALEHDSDLVECRVNVLERWSGPDGCRLKLSDGTIEFPALLRGTNGNPVSRTWLPGSMVRVTGVCAVDLPTVPRRPGAWEPQSFQIFLRSPADITVLQLPSWWNAEHVAWVTGGTAITLLLVVVLVVWTSRRKLREEALGRMKSEAEFTAVLNERSRMARELHDTLAQGLGAISLRLELAKRQLPAESSAQDTLNEAGNQTRASLDEVRGAIWNMRSQSLETGDLASAINSVLQSMTDRDQVKSELHIVGEPRRFAPMVENNLLRIAQEAIANAVKHARAKQIEVTLTFGRQQFELCVSDDGVGFNSLQPPASMGGFGLIGMRERSAELNANFTVTSAPKKGCIIKLVLPFSNS